MAVTDVGVRLALKGRREYVEGLKESEKATGKLGTSADTTGRKLDGLSKVSHRVGENIKTGLGAGVAAAGLAVGAGLVLAVKDGLARQAGNVHLAAQLGLDKPQAAQAARSAGKLYASNYGTGLEDINSGIRAVALNLPNIGKIGSAAFQTMTADALNFSSTFGVDVGDSTRAVGQLLRVGLVKDARGGMDLLTKGFQGPANKAGDLLDTFNEYSVQFKKLGLDGPAALGLITQGVKAGARDSDLAADALKEFSLRAVDGSTTSAAGFKALGLNARVMTEHIARGGPAAKAGLDTVLSRLRGVKDPAKQAQAAVALFGTQAEDMGKALYAFNVDTAVKGMDGVTGAAGRLDGTLNNNAPARLAALKRRLTGDIMGGVDKLLPTINRGITAAAGWGTRLRTEFKSGEGVGGSLHRTFDSLRKTFEDNKPALRTLGRELLAVGQFAVRYVLPPLAKFTALRFTSMVNGVLLVAGALRSVARYALSAFGNILGVVGSVAGVLAKIPGPTQHTMRAVADAAKGAQTEVAGMQRALENIGKTTVRPAVIFTVTAPGAAGKAARTAVAAKLDGHRALGGPVMAGRSYLVGEQTPEVFTPRVSGFITNPQQAAAAALTAPGWLTPSAPTGGGVPAAGGPAMRTGGVHIEHLQVTLNAAVHDAPSFGRAAYDGVSQALEDVLARR